MNAEVATAKAANDDLRRTLSSLQSDILAETLARNKTQGQSTKLEIEVATAVEQAEERLRTSLEDTCHKCTTSLQTDTCTTLRSELEREKTVLMNMLEASRFDLETKFDALRQKQTSSQDNHNDGTP